MSVASKKRRRWARRLARVQRMRRMAGLPEHEHPERVVFEAMRRDKLARHRFACSNIVLPLGVWL